MLSFINIIDYLNFYCAPCLLGKKPASLFSIPIEIYNKSQNKIEELKEIGFCIQLLYELDKKVHLLIFSQRRAMELFCQEKIKKAYQFFGYEDCFSFEVLKHKLFDRLYSFKMEMSLQDAKMFPHEIGLFLGYPPEDVLQYYLKQGKGYLFSGYWKVYTNPEKAIKTFKLYDECRAYCMEKEFAKNHLLSA